MFANCAAAEPADRTSGDQEGHRVAPAPRQRKDRLCGPPPLSTFLPPLRLGSARPSRNQRPLAPPVRGLGARCGSVTPAASLALLRRPVVRCAHPCTRRGPSAPGTGPESAPGRFRLRPWRRRRGRPPGVVAWSESHTATTPAAALRGAGGGCCWPVTPAGPLALYDTSMGGCALARRPAGQPIGPRAGLPSRAWPRLRPRGEASPGPRGRSALRCRCCRDGVGQGGGPGGGLSCPSGALEAAAAHDRPEGS